MSSQAPAIRSTFRRLIRAQRSTFKGDMDMQRIAMTEIRSKFRQQPAPSNDEIASKLKEAEDAIDFMENYVVQAPLNERGNYVVDAKTIDETKRS